MEPGKNAQLSSLISPKFLKQNFMHYVRKHLKTGLACSHELATFLKYHMPLIFLALA